jgi:hypothetical protein
MLDGRVEGNGRKGQETGKTGTDAEVAIQGPNGDGAGRKERLGGAQRRGSC